MNCQQICKKIHGKWLNRSKNIPKGFRGLLFWNTLYSNFGPILYRFRDTPKVLDENCDFSYPPYIRHPR